MKFLQDELFSLTLMATVQRARVYVEGAPDQGRRAFQDSLRRELERLVLEYKSQVSENRHESNIILLADTLSREHARVLAEGRFRIGNSQKALNLYLKYYWCLGEIDIPPHCPFDYKIIGLLPNIARVKWTELDDISTYQRVVRAAKNLAQQTPLAVWELHAYNL